MDLLKGIKVEEHTCRVCGRPCGMFDECDRCFLDRLESQFDELMDDAGKPALPDGLMDEVEWTDERPAEPETSAPPPPTAAPSPTAAPPPVAESPPVPDPKPEPDSEPEPEDEPEAQAATAPVPVAAEESPPREEHRPRIGLLLGAGLATVAAAIAMVVLRGGDDGVSTAAPEQPPPVVASEHPTAPVIGDWQGRVEVRYEGGFTDQLRQTISIDAVAEGEVAGFSRSRQNGGSCWGPLTFTGMRGDAFAFDYRERNTDECIARGEVTLTPRGEATMDYREVTKSSVNRGVLARQ